MDKAVVNAGHPADEQDVDEPGHGTVETARGTVHYWIRRHADPQAPCLVLTHGLTANHRMFEKQVEAFAGICTVLTWDVPLHGQSRPYRDFSYRNTAEDLRSILDQERLDQVVLVGMSMGGYPCQAFAMRYPERVRAFVALDTTPFGLSYYSRSDQWWLRQVGWMAKLFPDGTLRRSMAKSGSRTQYAYDMMMSMLEPLTKQEIAEQMDVAYGGFLKENADVDFRFPVVILLGEHDSTGKVRQYSEAWAKQEGYSLKWIPNAAHFSNADNPEAVNREIAAFLAGLG